MGTTIHGIFKQECWNWSFLSRYLLAQKLTCIFLHLLHLAGRIHYGEPPGEPQPLCYSKCKGKLKCFPVHVGKSPNPPWSTRAWSTACHAPAHVYLLSAEIHSLVSFPSSDLFLTSQDLCRSLFAQLLYIQQRSGLSSQSLSSNISHWTEKIHLDSTILYWIHLIK